MFQFKLHQFGQDGNLGVYKRVDKLYDFGMRLLLMGMSPERSFGKWCYQRIIVYLIITLFYPIYGTGELLWAILVPSDILDRLSHLYVASYTISFGVQWLYLLTKLEEVYENRIDLESLNSTKLVSNFAKSVLAKNFKSLFWSMVFLAFINAFGIVCYGLMAVLNNFLNYFATGSLEAVIILSYFPIPLWGQIVVAIANLITLTMSIVCIVSIYVITGLMSLEIETQSEILREALATSDESSIKGFVIEHVQLIKHTKWVIKLFEILNSPLFCSSYVCLAIQMLTLTLIEPNGHFYLGIACDFMNMFFIMAGQCWLSSAITNSMQTLADGVYSTPWFNKNKSNAQDVIMMTQMSQRPFVQRLFLGTMKIERGTMINVLQSSYSFYTILILLQSKK